MHASKLQFSNRPWWKEFLLTAGVSLLCASSVSAANVDFYRDVYPFLKANCLACHNKTTTKAGLDMETPESMKKGGDSGPAIVPGKSRESLIVLASLHQKDMEMPPANNKSGAVKLSSSEIALLKTWIDQGAKSSVQQQREVVLQTIAAGVDPIYSVALTKDGRYAVCGRSNNLFLYDLATRQFIAPIVDATQKSGTAHGAMVQSLAFSPDGGRLASGSYREVKIWRDDRSPALSRPATLELQLSVTTDDGQRIVGATPKGGLTVLDAVKGKAVKKISGVNKSGIKALGVSPDGNLAAVWGADSVLSIWNLKTGRQFAATTGIDDLRAIAWTADNRSVAGVTGDKRLRLWSLPAEAKGGLTSAKEITLENAAVTHLICGADLDLVGTLDTQGRSQIWSLSKGSVVRELAGVAPFAFSPNGLQTVTGGHDGVVRIWDVATGKQLSELRSRWSSLQQIAALEWTVAAQNVEQTFQKREVTRIEAQNKALDELLKKANEAIVAMQKLVPEKSKAVKPAQDAKAAAQKVVDEVLALIAQAPEGKADAALEKRLKDAQEKLAPVTMAETSALAAVSAAESNLKDAQDEVVRITETKTKNADALEKAKAAIDSSKQILDKATADLAAAKQALTKLADRPVAVAFSADSQRVAAVFTNGTLHAWALTSGAPVEQVDGAPAASASLKSGPNGVFTACHADGTTLMTQSQPRWVLERVLGTGKDKALFADRVNAVRFSPDGKTLAVGGGDPSRTGDISLFDLTKGKVLKTWRERHQDAVLSLDFSPDGRLLASGGADKIARVIDIAMGNQVNLFEGHTHHVMGVAFRADGRVLATAGADGAVIAWDMLLGERKRKIEGWTKEVTSLQFIGPTSQLVTSAGDNRIRIINDDGGEVRTMAGLPDFMQAAASTPNASVVIGGGEDSVLRVWDGTNGKELAVFGAK